MKGEPEGIVQEGDHMLFHQCKLRFSSTGHVGFVAYTVFVGYRRLYFQFSSLVLHENYLH